MQDISKTKRWVKVISVLYLVYALGSLSVHALTELSIVNDGLKTDVFETAVSIIGNLALFVGLWRFSTWAWHFAILYIPLSWLYMLYHMLGDYEKGIGLLIAPFLLIDGFVLRFLFKSEVRDVFALSAASWLKLNWLGSLLLLLAGYLIVQDLFGSLIAFIFALAMFMGIRSVQEYKRKYRIRENTCETGESEAG